MSSSVLKMSDVLTGAFNAGGEDKKLPAAPHKPAKKKRPAPLSLRLSAYERAELERLANGVALGAYVKARVFGEDAKQVRMRGRNPVRDYEALGRVLGALGQNALCRDLNRLAREIEAGKVVLSPQAEEKVGVACATILLMRDDLVKALGLLNDSSGGD